MRINLDKAEKLIGRIRAAEATLDRLYEEWAELVGGSIKSATSKPTRVNRGGRKPQEHSLANRIVTLFESDVTLACSAEMVATLLHETDVAMVKRGLEKQIYRGKLERRGRGEYGAKGGIGPAVNVEGFRLERTA